MTSENLEINSNQTFVPIGKPISIEAVDTFQVGDSELVVYGEVCCTLLSQQ